MQRWRAILEGRRSKAGRLRARRSTGNLVTIEGAFAAAGEKFFGQPARRRSEGRRIDRHTIAVRPLHQTGSNPETLPDLKESYTLGTRITADVPDVTRPEEQHGFKQDVPDELTGLSD